MLPLWLSPTQLRLIPVGEEYNIDCKIIAEKFQTNNQYSIRIDIDDREESVSRKIRDAEKEWIPIILVYGEKEQKEKRFVPRFRFEEFDKKETYTLDEIQKLIIDKINHYPHYPLPLPLFISKRPKFKG
jgi:threonyl-tRNA synthetase